MIKNPGRPPSPPARPESGQIVVLAALSIVLCVSVAGVALDYGASVARERQLQTAPDAATLVGAYEINNG